MKSSTILMVICPLLIHSLCIEAADEVSIPPKITLQSPDDIYYKVNETVMMVCEGSGQPHPGFSWKRNGVDFNPSGNDARITQLTKKGTLIINSPEDKDQAIYQCFASNSFGRAASIKFNLRMAKLDTFKNEDPIIHRVPLGSYLNMSCQSPDSVPDAAIYWAVMDKDGSPRPIDWNSTVSMDFEDRLHFAHITQLNHQNGQPYRCVAYNSMMRSNQFGPPQYINPTGASDQLRNIQFVWPKSRYSQSGLVGEHKVLKCIFAGNPTPLVQWKREDGKELPANRVLTGNSDGQELTFLELQPEDAGIYVCQASADISQNPVQMSFQLTVDAKPTWVKKMADVEIGQNATAMFECKADGVPKPTYSWFINGLELKEALKSDKRLDGRFRKLMDTKIYLERVTKDDAMVIQCNASNTHGYVFGEAYLNVLDEAPSILQVSGEVIKVAEGQPFEVKCVVAGKPDPIITWFKNDIQITGGRYEVLASGNIVVKKAVLSDAGTFRCLAVNKFGSVEDEAGTVIVRSKTVIEQKPRDLEVRSKAYAKFTCSGTTDPQETTNLRVIWMKDYKVIDIGERFFRNPQDNSLILSGAQVRDTGTFSCVLTNGLDNDTASARLEVTDVPDQPYAVEINNECKKKNISEVVWIPGSFNNAPIEYFTVEYSTSIDPNTWSFAQKVMQTKSNAFINLNPGLEYKFRVVTVNKIGSSTPSDPTTKMCSTIDNQPLQNPQNVRTIGNLPGMINLEWTPVLPKFQGGKGFRYNIHVRKVGQPESSTFYQTSINNWTTSSLTIANAGLDYQAYIITVNSENIIGDCVQQAKSIIGYSSEGLPTIKPTNLESAGLTIDSVTLRWTFPRSEINTIGTQVNGEFMGFQVQMWEKNRRVETIRQWLLPPTSFATVNGTFNTDRFNITLKHSIPNAPVEAAVAVLNNFYIGAPCEKISFNTLPGFPGPVNYLEAEVIGDNHITVQWSRPLDDRTDVIGYDIGYQEVLRGLELGEMQDVQPSIDDPYASHAMVDGLRPLTKYRIHLWARTVAGRGESYFIERSTSSPKKVIIPTYNIPNVGSDHINVSWWQDEYLDSSSVVYVEYKKLDSAEWFSTSPDLSRTWVDIKMLQPGMDYQVRVVVTNGVDKMVSVEQDVKTDGYALAYDVVGNLGWFLAIFFSILVHIGLIILFCIGYKRGFRFKKETQRMSTYRQGGETYTDTDRIEQKSAEPKGHRNDYYEDKDSYEDFEDKGYNDYRSDEKPPMDDYDDRDYEDYTQNNQQYDDDVKPRSYSTDEPNYDKRPWNDRDDHDDEYNYDDRYGGYDNDVNRGHDDYPGYNDGYYDDQGNNDRYAQPDFDDYDDQYDQRHNRSQGDRSLDDSKGIKMDVESSTFV